MRNLSQCITKYTLNTLQFYLLIILNKAEKNKSTLELKAQLFDFKVLHCLIFSNFIEV